MTSPDPMEPDRYHCDCGRALPCRHCPDRIDALFPDVIDLLAEQSATRRVTDRHTNDEEDES